MPLADQPNLLGAAAKVFVNVIATCIKCVRCGSCFIQRALIGVASFLRAFLHGKRTRITSDIEKRERERKKNSNRKLDGPPPKGSHSSSIGTRISMGEFEEKPKYKIGTWCSVCNRQSGIGIYSNTKTKASVRPFNNRCDRSIFHYYEWQSAMFLKSLFFWTTNRIDGWRSHKCTASEAAWKTHTRI